MKTTKLVLTIVVSLFSFSAILAQNHNHDHSKEGHKKMKMDAKKEYTCSMHPEVKSDKPGDCPKCGMKLIEKKEWDTQKWTKTRNYYTLTEDGEKMWDEVQKVKERKISELLYSFKSQDGMIRRYGGKRLVEKFSLEKV